MGRILAIDYGLKRIGLAVTDPLKISANGLDTVLVTDIHMFLKKYIATEKVEAIVLGWPMNLNNQASASLPYVQEFYNWLLKTFVDIPVHKYDERFTSVMAKQAMLAGGVKKKDRQDKALVDKVSATIILQNFLESNRVF